MNIRKNRSDLSLFPHYLKQSAWLCFFSGILSVPASLLTAELVAEATDAAVAGSVCGVLSAGAILLVFLLALHFLIAAAKTAAARSAAVGTNRVRQAVYRRYLRRPLAELAAEKNGNAKEKLNDDLNKLADCHTSLLPKLAASLCMAFVYLIYLLLKSPLLALTFAAMALVLVLPPLFLDRFFERFYADTRKIEARLTDYVVSGYHGFAEIRLYGLKAHWLAGLKSIHKAYIKIGNRTEVVSSAQYALTHTLADLLKYGAFGVAGAFVLWDGLAVSVAVAAATLAGRFFAAVNEIFEKFPELATAKAARDRLAPWLKTEKEVFADRTALESVSFGDVLRNVTISVRENSVTAVLGANGAGKSTLLKLLTGQYRPDSGIAQTLDPCAIAYLPQEDAELGISAGELLAMIGGAESIARRFGLTDEQFAIAADELSGGERKKIFLSLVFAADAKLLVLDEPTNSLDVSGIETLRALIVEYCGTILLVSHGDALADLADCVVHVENGEVTMR